MGEACLLTPAAAVPPVRDGAVGKMAHWFSVFVQRDLGRRCTAWGRCHWVSGTWRKLSSLLTIYVRRRDPMGILQLRGPAHAR